MGKVETETERMRERADRAEKRHRENLDLAEIYHARAVALEQAAARLCRELECEPERIGVHAQAALWDLSALLPPAPAAEAAAAPAPEPSAPRCPSCGKRCETKVTEWRCPCGDALVGPPEPSAPSVEPDCECGHVRDEHDGECVVDGCGCIMYDPAAPTPEPSAPEPRDSSGPGDTVSTTGVRLLGALTDRSATSLSDEARRAARLLDVAELLDRHIDREEMPATYARLAAEIMIREQQAEARRGLAFPDGETRALLLHVWMRAQDAARTWRAGDVSACMAHRKRAIDLVWELLDEAARRQQ